MLVNMLVGAWTQDAHQILFISRLMDRLRGYLPGCDQDICTHGRVRRECNECGLSWTNEQTVYTLIYYQPLPRTHRPPQKESLHLTTLTTDSASLY
jgi:hypothetical protein